MTKPLGYYVDTNIPVIGDLEREYGSNLEGMPQVDKLFLIQNVAADLGAELVDSGAIHTFSNLSDRIRDEISKQTDALALLKALVNSL